MTTFDTYFDLAAKEADLSWCFVYDNSSRNIEIDRKLNKFPVIFRSFSEPLQPNFNKRNSFDREMSLYICEVGFDNATSEVLSSNLELIMSKFIIFRNFLRRKGIELTFTQKPFPNWMQTNYKEYGYVFNLTANYSTCLN